MKTLLFIFFLLTFWIPQFLDNVLRSVNPKELKRRARSGNSAFIRLHKLSAYRALASPFLWLISGLSLGGLIITAQWNSWAILVMALGLSWLFWSAKAPKNYSGWRLKLASVIALPVSWLLGYLQPLAGRFIKEKPPRVHTGAYEKEDLLELIRVQHHQPDNRISDDDLKLALGALQFGDKTVRSVMRSRKSVKWVGEDEDIGPLLMDELHASGLDSFPVVKDTGKKSASPEVIGTLYLRDIVDHTAGGRVASLMHKQVYFINESDNLREALNAFSKTHHHLLVVINNFEEVVGILTFDILASQILGDKPGSEFDQYHDKRAVASREAEKP